MHPDLLEPTTKLVKSEIENIFEDSKATNRIIDVFSIQLSIS